MSGLSRMTGTRNLTISITALLRTLANRNNSVFVLLSIIIILLIADTSISRLTSVLVERFSAARFATFVFIGIISVVAPYFILKFVKKENISSEMAKRLHVTVIHRITEFSQYLLVAIFLFVVFQMMIFSFYSIAALTLATVISYTLASIMMSLLAVKFFEWFRSNRNSVVFLYGLSSGMITINLAVTCLFVADILQSQPAVVLSYHLINVPFIAPGSIADLLNYPYVVSSILSFILAWIATAWLLRHHSHSLGTMRFWVILCFPLIFFLLQFGSLFTDLLSPFFRTQPVIFGTLYTLFFASSKPVGGILFGIAFWTLAQKIRNNIVIRNYLLLSAYGFMLLFVSNQAIVLTFNLYPPFALPSVCFMGISSYLLMISIYSSATSLAQDIKLRRSIKSSAIKELELLDRIGTADMEQELEKRVLNVVKAEQNNLIEQTGVQTSLTEEDMKSYLDQVLVEIEKSNINRRRASVKQEEEFTFDNGSKDKEA
jgi:hypothetical protein